MARQSRGVVENLDAQSAAAASAAATYARVSGERYEASANGTSGGHVVKCVCVERKDTQIFSRVV